MLKDQSLRLHTVLVVMDVAGAALALLLLTLLFAPEAAAPAAAGGVEAGRWVALLAVSCLAWPTALNRLQLYDSQRRHSLLSVTRRLLIAGVFSTAVLAASAQALALPLPPEIPILAGLAHAGVLTLARVAIHVGLRFARRLGRNYRNVLIVGSGPRAAHVRALVEQNPQWGVRIMGYVDETDEPLDPTIPSESVHKLVDVPALLGHTVIDEVIIACPRSLLTSIGPVVGACAAAGIPFTMLTDIFGDYLPPPRVTRFDALAALSFAPVHHSRAMLGVKRGLDVTVAAAGLALGAPLLAVSALAIRATSPGPIFFRQVRCGLNGRPFEMLKLRTMCANAEEQQEDLLHLNEMDGPVFKLRDDPRVTWVGRFLRRYSMDEIPQLWNVLCGDMSLVGPRPAVPHEVAQYDTNERRRLSMRPGLTCLWQVSGRNDIGFDEWVRLDLEYIDTWSLHSDTRILLRTIPAVLSGTGT